MGLTVTNEKKREPIPDGVYQAVATGVIDLGTQFNEHFQKSSRQVLFIWEIPELLIKFEKNGLEVEAPRVISKKYTASWHEKANLRKDLQSWRGRAFTEDEMQSFDISTVVGKNCMLQIINTTKDGKQYSNIASILPLYSGLKNVAPFMDIAYFSLEDGYDIPTTVPVWVRDIIFKSEEFKSRVVDCTAEPSDVDVPF